MITIMLLYIISEFAKNERIMIFANENFKFKEKDFIKLFLRSFYGN